MIPSGCWTCGREYSVHLPQPSLASALSAESTPRTSELLSFRGGLQLQWQATALLLFLSQESKWGWKAPICLGLWEEVAIRALTTASWTTRDAEVAALPAHQIKSRNEKVNVPSSMGSLPWPQLGKRMAVTSTPGHLRYLNQQWGNDSHQLSYQHAVVAASLREDTSTPPTLCVRARLCYLLIIFPVPPAGRG